VVILHGVDAGDRGRPRERSHGDIRQADPGQLSLVTKRRESKDALLHRLFGQIDSVQVIEINLVAPEHTKARLDVRPNPSRADIRIPRRRAGSCMTSLGANDHTGAPGGFRCQLFSVQGRVDPGVRTRGVENRRSRGDTYPDRREIGGAVTWREREAGNPECDAPDQIRHVPAL
jgi:hypothetical protein